MPWNRHHSPGSVGCDDKVTEPNGNVLTRQGVNGIPAREDTFLLVHVLDAVEF